MRDAPQVNLGDWIKIGSMDAVVCDVRAIDPAAGGLEVVCNPERPAIYEVNWNGEGWEFAHPMRGDYAERVPGVEAYVKKLTQGPPKKGPQLV